MFKGRVLTLTGTALATVGVLGAVSLGSPALASGGHDGQPSSTTLDACGYFVGMQTPANATSQGQATHGTWTGVTNNYYGTPVASLGSVSGTFTQRQSTDAAGDINGVEHFRSASGDIDQTYGYTPAGGWVVSVNATGALSFLTSDTNGHCYTGTLPRP